VTVSDWSEVKSGVPQVSVLGPLLFVIYINDLPVTVVCECKMYADDSKLISVNLDALNGIQNDIDAVTSWTKDWLMRLNVRLCT
jgi:ribonuclease P/MRP protein subunit RPP40